MNESRATSYHAEELTIVKSAIVLRLAPAAVLIWLSFSLQARAIDGPLTPKQSLQYLKTERRLQTSGNFNARYGRRTRIHAGLVAGSSNPTPATGSANRIKHALKDYSVDHQRLASAMKDC